jgi:hypothetical protein
MSEHTNKKESRLYNLPPLGIDAQGNLLRLVEFYKKYSPFTTITGWDWDAQSWNVKGVCKAQLSKSQNNQYLNFTRRNGLGPKVKTATTEMKPFYSTELADIAKCHICSKQIKAPKNYSTLQQTINGYRFLDEAIAKSEKLVEAISTADFERAELLARKHLKDSTFDKLSSVLEEIQRYLITKKLTKHKPTFKKTKMRGELKLPSDTRIDQESINSRNEKLPTLEALKAVATISNLSLTGRDILLQSLTEILFATGLRFGEAIALDVDCLRVYRKEVFNEITGRYFTKRVVEIRYKPEKGGIAPPKEIPKKSLAKILIKAVKRVRKHLAALRLEIEKVSNNKLDYFPELLSNEQVFTPDAAQRLNWSSSSNLITFIKSNLGITLPTKRNPRTGIKTKVIDADILKLEALNSAKSNLDEFTEILKGQSLASSPDKLLFVQNFQENHAKKRAVPWKYQLFTETEYSDFLSGRVGEKIESIFKRALGIELSEKDTLTSHKFRHFLNTMAQLSDTVSEIEIARYFGRKYLGDNEAYDHTNPIKRVFDNADVIVNSSPINNDRKKEAFVMFPLVEKEEVFETIEDLATTMVTSIGLCQHDFSESPCGKHYACLRGCREYQRTKGDQREIDEIQDILAQHEKHYADAKEAVEAKFHGANNWLQSHARLIDGCKRALEIEHNDGIQVGETINVFPEGINGCEAA